MKIVLGVKPSSNTCLIYTETGRFPLYVSIYKQIISYWLKLTRTSEHRFIVIAYHENHSEWSLFVKKLLYENGFGDVWETDAKYVNHSLFIQQSEQRLKDVFMYEISKLINFGNVVLIMSILVILDENLKINFTEIGTLIIYLTLSNITFCILMTVLLLFTKIYFNKINIFCTSFC